MKIEIEKLEPGQLEKMLPFASVGSLTTEALERAYFSEGSVACCLLADGEPVFAGGIVNLQWGRGEAWIVPTPFFKRHLKTCFSIIKKFLPKMAVTWGFRRVQAVCFGGVSGNLFSHLGFKYEGKLSCFGPSGEDCSMYARIFSGEVSG